MTAGFARLLSVVMSGLALCAGLGCSSFGSVSEKYSAAALSYDASSAAPAAEATAYEKQMAEALRVAAPAAPPPADAPAATRPVDPRQVIYSASFRVVVANVAGTLSEIREMSERLGGYMQEVSGGVITVRVRANEFHNAVKFVEGLGEVVDRQLKAQDVTEELHDLRTHIDNHEKLRQRFQELLAKTEKVEDALKVERELARVTEELDRAKGKLRFLESQVAMSSIRVELNSPLPQTPGGGSGLPFDWVSALGEGLVEGQVKQTVREAGIFGRGPRFKPPGGFVRFYENNGHVEAMDAGELRLRVLRRDNIDKAPLSFWSTLVRKSLLEGRSLAISGEESGKNFYVLRGTRDVGGKTLGYLLGLKRSDRRVVAFEAWGPKESNDQKFDELRASALSVDAG